MTKKLTLIVGASGVGKDWIAKAFNLNMVISHTTRPMRKGDVNGETKWFHKNYSFETPIIAHTFFDGHHYWVTDYDLIGKEAYIIDVPGVQCLCNAYGKYFDDMFSIVYISCAWYKRLYRLIKRDGIKKGVKRFVHDIGKFSGIKDFDYTEIRV